MYKVIFLITAALLISCNNSGSTKTDEPVKVETSAASVAESGKPIHLTKQEFLDKVMNYEANPTEWKFEGDIPCLVDFYADWCGPCRQAAPVLEELAEEYKGKIHIYKVNTETERELASAFRIQGIPAFLFCPMDGKPTMSSGIARTPEETKQMFKRMIDEILLNSKS